MALYRLYKYTFDIFLNKPFAYIGKEAHIFVKIGLLTKYFRFLTEKSNVSFFSIAE